MEIILIIVIYAILIGLIIYTSRGGSKCCNAPTAMYSWKTEYCTKCGEKV